MVVHTDLSARGSRFGEFRFAPPRPFQPLSNSLLPSTCLTLSDIIAGGIYLPDISPQASHHGTTVIIYDTTAICGGQLFPDAHIHRREENRIPYSTQHSQILRATLQMMT
jgi:hypothetical protein